MLAYETPAYIADDIFDVFKKTATLFLNAVFDAYIPWLAHIYVKNSMT